MFFYISQITCKYCKCAFRKIILTVIFSNGNIKNNGHIYLPKRLLAWNVPDWLCGELVGKFSRRQLFITKSF